MRELIKKIGTRTITIAVGVIITFFTMIAFIQENEIIWWIYFIAYMVVFFGTSIAYYYDNNDLLYHYFTKFIVMFWVIIFYAKILQPNIAISYLDFLTFLMILIMLYGDYLLSYAANKQFNEHTRGILYITMLGFLLLLNTRFINSNPENDTLLLNSLSNSINSLWLVLALDNLFQIYFKDILTKRKASVSTKE